jgi:hypothetical protein
MTASKAPRQFREAAPALGTGRHHPLGAPQGTYHHFLALYILTKASNNTPFMQQKENLSQTSFTVTTELISSLDH